MSTSENYFEEVERYYKRNFIAAIIDNAMFSFIRIGLSPYTILPFYLKHLTDSNILIGLIPTVFILGFTAPQLPIAKYLQNNKQRKNILVISSVEQRLCILGLIFLTVYQKRLPDQLTIIFFFTFYLLYNLGRGCYSPTYIDFIGRVVSRNRGRMLGIGNFFGGILTLVGTGLLTGLLITLPYPQAITAIFALSFFGSLVSLAAILSWKDILPPENRISAEEQGVSSSLKKELIPPGNFKHYLGWRSIIAGLEMMLPFYAIHGLAKFHLADSYLGIFTAIMTISDTVMNPIWGWLGDKGGYLRIVIAASILGCLGAMIAAGSNNLFLYSMVFVLNGMMLSGQMLGNFNIIFEFATKVKIPAYSAMSQVVLAPLSGLAPVIGGFFIGRFGNGMSSLFAGFIGAIGVIGMTMNVRNPKYVKIQTSSKHGNLDD
jgi:MFS family permease